MQLDGDAQVHVGVQRVPMSAERHRVPAPRDQLEDGRLHLHESAPVEGPAHRAQHLGPGLEMAALGQAGHQVVVALAVAGLLVLEPVVLLGGLAQRLDQGAEAGCEDGGLAALGPHQGPLHPDDVPEVEQPNRGEPRLAETVEAEPDLEAAGLVLQVGEAAPALQAVQHQPARDLRPVVPRRRPGPGPPPNPPAPGAPPPGCGRAGSRRCTGRSPVTRGRRPCAVFRP